MCSGLIVMIMLRTMLLNYFSIIQKSMTQIILFASIKGEIRMIINFIREKTQVLSLSSLEALNLLFEDDYRFFF